MALKDELKQQNGFAHGGVVGALADSALALAAGTVLGTNVVTSEYKINFVRPALGESLIARSSVVSAGKRQAVCSCSVLRDQRWRRIAGGRHPRYDCENIGTLPCI